VHIIKIIGELNDRRKYFDLSSASISLLVSLSLISTVLEVFGISIFFPIFQFMRLEGDINALISESDIWSYIVDSFVYLNIDLSLTWLLLITFLSFSGRQLFTYLRIINHAKIAQELIKKMRDRLFVSYLEADAVYYEKLPIGNFSNTVVTETASAVFGIMAPIELIALLMVAIVYVTILFFLSVEMTIGSILVLLLATQAPRGWVKRSAIVGRKLTSSNTNMSSFLVGRLKSPRLVRLSDTQEAECQEFGTLIKLQKKYAIFSSVLAGRTEVIIEPIIVGLSLVFLYLAYTNFGMSIEAIGLYLLIVVRMIPIVKSMVLQWQKIQRFLGSVEIVEDRLNEMSRLKEIDKGSIHLKDSNCSLQLIDVGFCYPSNNLNTLSNININFKPGSMTAIVGPSGSGKSTLVDLLPRVRAPSSGSIFINGLDLSQYTLSSLRSVISYLPQSPQIFEGTIEDHIRYGNRNASDKQIKEAALIAGADSFIEKLPNGYQAQLDEDGQNLSGGQRQRLDFARVLVKDSPILILDEPTSNLDLESEKLFMKTLNNIHRNKNTTIIIITHKLRSTINAKQIMVLRHGSIEAHGTHKELLSQNSWYASAWEKDSDH